MQIDWITVGAQILNFLVLVWLLNVLLYRPVTRAMAAREESIRDRFADAERREAEAAAEAEKHRAERAEIEERRVALLSEAQEDAHELAHRLESEARAEIEARRDAWADQVKKEQAHFLGELRHQVAGHVGRVARRVLSDLAGAELETAMADAFIRQIRALQGKTLHELRAEAEDAHGTMAIESAFVLGAPDRSRLEEAVRDTIHPDPRMDFRKEPALVCGVRLRIRGQTLQWNVDDYLDSLQDETGALLDATGGEEPVEEPIGEPAEAAAQR